MIRYGARGDKNPRFPVTLAKELVEETQELAGMEADAPQWLTKDDVWCIFFKKFLVTAICVDRVQCEGFPRGLAHIRANAVRPKRKRFGQALLHEAFTFLADEAYVVADVDASNAASLACLKKSANTFERGTEPIGIVDTDSNKRTMRKGSTTNPVDCVEYVFAKDLAKFWTDAKECGAWNGSEVTVAETTGGKKNRAPRPKEICIKGGARKQYKAAKKARATGKKKAKK